MSFEVSPKTFREQGLKPETAERLSLVWHLRHGESMTFKQIGKSIGVCPQMAHIAVRRSERLVRHATDKNKPWHYGLSVRAVNCLNQDTMYLENLEKNKEAIRSAVFSGRIHLEKLRNCGKKTTKEILIWLSRDTD